MGLARGAATLAEGSQLLGMMGEPHCNKKGGFFNEKKKGVGVGEKKKRERLSLLLGRKGCFYRRGSNDGLGGGG